MDPEDQREIREPLEHKDLQDLMDQEEIKEM